MLSNWPSTSPEYKAERHGEWLIQKQMYELAQQKRSEHISALQKALRRAM